MVKRQPTWQRVSRSALAIGLMSGTSVDGVSAALVRFRSRAFRLLGYETTPYPMRIVRLLRRIDALRVGELSRLNVEIGETFANAALRLMRRHRLAPRRLRVIGSHGQTIYHGPRDHPPSTWQIGDPSVIAERTGVPVVADFRPRDIAAGGEGAPLVPFFDQFFYGDGPVTAFQNLGGIGNVTIVGRALRRPMAFDTGPGNCLMDEAIRSSSPLLRSSEAAKGSSEGAKESASRGRSAYDRDGALARRGRVDEQLLAKLQRHPFFRRRPPKSTGTETWNLTTLQRDLGIRWPRRLEDQLATLARLTAWSVAESLRRWAPRPVTRIVVSGGGARNATLMCELAAACAPVPVRSIETLGIPAQAKEPITFAFLALQAVEGRINHLPATTGACGARILGLIVPGGRAGA